MDNKIAISSIASAIAAVTGKSRKMSEDFTREFFKLIADGLQEEGIVKVRGFGTFKLVGVEKRMSVNVNTGAPHEIAAHKKVVFTPTKDLASQINAPFEEFESVEMDDEIPADVFEESLVQDKIPENEEDYETPEHIYESVPEMNDKLGDEDLVSASRLEEGSAEENADDEITYEAYELIETQQEEKLNSPEESDEKDALKESEESKHNEAHSHNYVNSSFDDEYEYEERISKTRFGAGFLIGALSMFAVCVVIFMLGCFFEWWPVNFGWLHDNYSQIDQTEFIETIPVDTMTEENAEDEMVKEPVYDTVTTTRYLTTIAREHYGDYNFWPYIYMENADILGHPDRITPGTKVIVPELSKYGVDPSNKEDVAIAKKKGVEIYSRFK